MKDFAFRTILCGKILMKIEKFMLTQNVISIKRVYKYVMHLPKCLPCTLV